MSHIDFTFRKCITLNIILVNFERFENMKGIEFNSKPICATRTSNGNTMILRFFCLGPEV